MSPKPKFKRQPPVGICIPVELVEVRDADTQVYRIARSWYQWAVRLIDVWAPEKRKPDPAYALAIEGKEWVERKLRAAHTIRLFIPEPANTKNMLANVTFDRVPGYIFVDKDRLTLNEQIVIAGFASSMKGGPYGK